MGEAAGITFCFAQAFHPAMRHAAPTRRELGIGTIFNSLGPLTNPGQPTYAAVGVAETRVADLIAGVFAARGRPAIVFRGDDGLDELTLSGPSHLWWVSQGIITRYVIAPGDFGLALAPIEALRAQSSLCTGSGPQRRGRAGTPGRSGRPRAMGGS